MGHQTNLFHSEEESTKSPIASQNPIYLNQAFPLENNKSQTFFNRELNRSNLSASQNFLMFSGPEAARNKNLVNIVSGVFNESFGYRPDGRAYRLGPKSTVERLNSTDFLFIAGDENFGIGYLFGKEIACMGGRVAWIESMAVLPLYRKQGIATALVERFRNVTKGSSKLGCATPNPIAALIVSKSIPGKLYIGNCSPPPTLIQMLREIRKHCFDLRGCVIQEKKFRIKTGFSPLSRSDQREWNPRTASSTPYWWSDIEHLPNEYEALLVIERKDKNSKFSSVKYSSDASVTKT